MKRVVWLLAAAALIGGCGEDPVATITPEIFSGIMVLDPEYQSNPMQIEPESTGVMLVVEGASYELIQTEGTSLNLCDSRGTVQGFGTNRAMFTPTGIIGAGNCDSLHLMKGEFPTVFRGDSLYIGPTTIHYTINVLGVPKQDDLTYHLKLRQTK